MWEHPIAVPAAAGRYQGFAYEAIAVSFNNSDLVETMEITAFDGKSSSYVVRSDRRVIVSNNRNQMQDIYNLLAMLRPL